LEIKGPRGIKLHMKSKKMVPDYFTYLKWRGLVAEKDVRIPYTVSYASAPPIFRERDRIFALHGSRCGNCGSIQYPPQRICAKCQSKDCFETIPLYDKKGKIFSSSKDPITGDLVGLVNFEGGGRILCNLTDADISEFKIDTPVEMSFRRLGSYFNDPIIRYFWKAIPLR